ncbi:phosphatase PAP2 family protein [Variovorax sp. GB1P17]|uniref:phosphatase PAP2 family protein n=1 Tax=Variovorax sp. GB1P17 TaxID=3443740 RepID=UPI003F4722C7
MQGLDVTLFGLINAGPSVPAWSLQFASFASDFLPALLALAVGVGALFDRRWRHVFFTGLVSVVLVWVIVNVFRSLVPIPRPAFYGLGIQWVPQGMRPGFPSLHVAGTFAAAFSLWCLPWRAPMLAALALAAVVAWSRLYLGLHFPSDVLAAMMLGALVSLLVERYISRPLAFSVSRSPLVRRRSRVKRV